MKKIVKTPFSEYREEQVKLNIFDYFVEPSFFERFCDTKPILISGARGTGKTTILKALTLAETKDRKQYLESNNYIGVYHRLDLNITTSFQGEDLKKANWEKLFAYYFVAKLSYELTEQFVLIKKDIQLENEAELCQKYAKLFSRTKGILTLEQLKMLISDELDNIRDFINNYAYSEYPHIGDYAVIIRELPKDLLAGSSECDMRNKTIFYLVDEFEGLYDWQQKIVLSFVKYADKYHSYKICMRPDGLKTTETVGAEYVRETDDVRTVRLNDLILENKKDYYKYALDVCKKRMELFYNRNNINAFSNINFEDLFEEITEDEEFETIFKKKEVDLKEEIKEFMKQVEVTDIEIREFFSNHFFDFLICRLLYLKNNSKEKFTQILNHVRNRDNKYTDAVRNYKYALLYYLCYKYRLDKNYSGFRTLAAISGGTLRYLLELCDEIYERAVSGENFDYENPHKISCKIQTDAVMFVSNKRVNQISAIPQLGLNIRTFVISLGKIFSIFHHDERIAKFEPNHFSIKAATSYIDEEMLIFLKECVIRGVLLKSDNNKQKIMKTISFDEYIYRLHPIYTPCFKISWRMKQKAEFNLDELKVFISNDVDEINKIIKNYKKKYLSQENEEYFQMKLSLEEDE